MTRAIASSKGVEHVANGFANDRGVVEGDAYFMPAGKRLDNSVERGFGVAVDVKRVGAGELGDAEADGVVAIEAQIRAVILGAQFGAAYIFQSDQSAVRAGPSR